jgi:hypothetical protein
MMEMGEMTKALQFYIKTFKVFGADITYRTDDGALVGSMVIPAGQFCVDEFAVRLEFFEGQSESVVNLMDGTGCIITTINPENGRDMLKKLRIMIPPKSVTLDTKVTELLDLMRKIMSFRPISKI